MIKRLLVVIGAALLLVPAGFSQNPVGADQVLVRSWATAYNLGFPSALAIVATSGPAVQSFPANANQVLTDVWNPSNNALTVYCISGCGGGGGGSTVWSDLTLPTGNLALSMAAHTSLFTYGNATGAGINVWDMTDTASNTGTGYIFRVRTASSSAAKAVGFFAKGTSNGVELTNAGIWQKVGSGSVNADQCNASTCGTVTSVGALTGVFSTATGTTTPAFSLVTHGVLTAMTDISLPPLIGTFDFSGLTTKTGIWAAANGGTGVANTATLTLGSSNQNWATLATGIVKNTTITGALSAAAAADVVALFNSGTCSGYLKSNGNCDTPGGSGTVTVVGSGSLTSTAIVTGGGTTTLQTPAATATMDSSGNISTPGTLSTGAGGSIAGTVKLTQGTAPSAAAANTIQIHAPTSVTTAYDWILPAADSTGFLLFTDSSNVGTGSLVGFTGTLNVVRATSPTITTPSITSIKDGNGNPFLLSSATASAVDSVTVTNAATANPARVTVGASGSDSNINMQVAAKGSGKVELGSTNATVDSSGNLVVVGCTGCGSGGTPPVFPTNAQTSTYQTLAGDFSNFKRIVVASGTFTVTMVASGSQPTDGQGIMVLNYGSGVVTIARSGQNINGAAANLTMAAGSASAPTGVIITSDGTNYFAQPLSTPTANQNIRDVPFFFDGGGSALSGTITRCNIVDYAGTINGVTLIADVSGSVTVDVKTVVYGSYTGPASASSITASAVPALSSAVKYQDTTLTGWTTALAANTVVCMALSSPTTIAWVEGHVKVAVN